MRSEFDFHWQNWAGNQSCTAGYYFEPETENDISDIVKKAQAQNKKIRVVGTGHSFSPIALSNGILISLKKMDRIISTDGNLVTVQGGTTLKELYAHLKKNNLSLPNYGVINKQTIAGAIATGTHGSGINLKSLSASVHSMKMIKADGTTLSVSKNSSVQINNEKLSLIDFTNLSLGLLGIVTEITLQCEPMYYVRSEEKVMDLDEYLDSLNSWHRKYDFLKAWWFPHTDKAYVYLSERITKEAYDARKDEKYTADQKKKDGEIDKKLSPLFKKSLHDASLIPKINKDALETYFTDRIKYGTSMDMLVHEETVPMIVSEFALTLEHDQHLKALKELKTFIDKNPQLHFPVDLRFTAQEDSFLSTSYSEPVFHIGMCVREHQGKEIPEVMQNFIRIMKKYEARPNWGKISDASKKYLERNFKGYEKFKFIREQFDPEKRFMNEITEEWFG